MTSRAKVRPLFDPAIVRGAVVDSFRKLDPRHVIRNPVMFVVEVVSVLTTVLFFQAMGGHGEAAPGFILAVSLWLWFTVLFANFAEAMAEGRGKAQAEGLRKARRDIVAKKLTRPQDKERFQPVAASGLRRSARLSLRRAAQAGAVLVTANGWLQMGLYFVVLLLLAKPLGALTPLVQ